MKKLSLLLMAILCPLNAFAKTPSFTSENAIKAIIGEAENQGYDGMYAVACAIRNRGTLKGVYGVNAQRVKKQLYSHDTWVKARKAWFDSKNGPDVTIGSISWENLDFGEPYWAKSMTKTVKIGSHTFYK